MTELRPCPFCGGEAKIADVVERIGGRSNGTRWKYVYCRQCLAQGAQYDWEDRKDMIAAWNRRTE